MFANVIDHFFKDFKAKSISKGDLDDYLTSISKYSIPRLCFNETINKSSL